MTPTNAADPFPVMENMTVKLVREYLRRKKSIIVPLGVIEQHGYHLPLKTDALLAGQIAKRIGQRADVLVSPVICTSFSGGGLPGTINISPAVMSLVVSDTLLSLAAQGFRNFYIWLSHGGSENARALDNALKLLLRTNPAFSHQSAWQLWLRCSGFLRSQDRTLHCWSLSPNWSPLESDTRFSHRRIRTRSWDRLIAGTMVWHRQRSAR